MPCLIYLQERLTHNYNNGWQHLDKWGDGGWFHILSESAPAYPDATYNEHWSRYLRIKAPYGMPRNTVERILNSSFQRSCACEHDCCGHVFTSTGHIKRLRRREWLVEVRYRVNC